MNNTKEFLLEEFKEKVIGPIIEDTTLDCIKVNFSKEYCTIFNSKVGGVPYFPENFKYPTVKEGEYEGLPLRFLSQVNFSELPYLEGLPKEGILQFYVLDNDVIGMDFDDMMSQNTFRIIYHEVVSEEVNQQQIPEKAYNKEKYFPVQCELKMNFKNVKNHITNSDFRFDSILVKQYNKIFPKKTIESSYDLPEEFSDYIFDTFNEEYHQIGGYGYFINTDPRCEDRYSNNTIQLLQIVSDMENNDGYEITWGGYGVCNFFISKEDLRNKDFSRVLYTWDCC